MLETLPLTRCCPRCSRAAAVRRDRVDLPRARDPVVDAVFFVAMIVAAFALIRRD